MSIRRRTWEILELGAEDDRTSRYVDIALFTLVGANVLAIIVESVPRINLAYEPFFQWFDIISVILFSMEYMLRVWSCVENPERQGRSHTATRIRFMATPMALIDLAAIAPFYFHMIHPVMDLRFLRVLRMLRIFKLTRYSSAMNVLLRVLHQERKAFSAALTILMMMLIIVSCGIHLVEGHIQPEAFGSIPDSMWWALTTLTTVGYGDVTPITPLGKIFGALVMVIGVGMVALPSGILASSFSELLRRRQQEFRLSVKKALEDGDITEEEAVHLERIREELDLTKQDSIELRSQAQKELEVAKDYEVAWEKIAIKDAEGHDIKIATTEQPQDTGRSEYPHVCPHCGGKLPG